jgi:hypothetical protein
MLEKLQVHGSISELNDGHHFWQTISTTQSLHSAE